MSYFNPNSSSCSHSPLCSFDFDRRNQDVRYACQRRINNLEDELRLRDQEINDLRFQVEEKERINKQLYMDLEKCESDLMSAERDYRRNELDILADLRSLEVENKNILRSVEERPGFVYYTEQINDLKNQLGRKEYITDMLQQSFNRIQNALGGSNFKLFQDLDISTLKVKLYEIENAIENQVKNRLSDSTSQTTKEGNLSMSGSQKRDYMGNRTFSSYENDFMR
jgi:hypothetical protein